MNDDFLSIYAMPDLSGNHILFTTTLYESRIPTCMKQIDSFIYQKKLCPSIELDPLYIQYINRLKTVDESKITGYNNLYERIINEGDKLMGDYRHFLKTRLNSKSSKEEISMVVHSLPQVFQNITIEK